MHNTAEMAHQNILLLSTAFHQISWSIVFFHAMCQKFKEGKEKISLQDRSFDACTTKTWIISVTFFVDQVGQFQISNCSDFFCLHFLSAADLDQQDYRTADLPALPLPRSTRRQPTPREAQQIQRMIQRMLSFEPRQRPSLNEVVAAFENFVRRFPMSWIRW